MKAPVPNLAAAGLPDLGPTALSALCREIGLELLILFGSRASGHARSGSDLDVGFVRSAGPADAMEHHRCYERLAPILGGAKLDLVDLHRASGLLKHLACERGRLLFESHPGVFTAFRVRAWSLYQDERIQIRRHDREAIRIALRKLAS